MKFLREKSKQPRWVLGASPGNTNYGLALPPDRKHQDRDRDPDRRTAGAGLGASLAALRVLSPSEEEDLFGTATFA